MLMLSNERLMSLRLYPPRYYKSVAATPPAIGAVETVTSGTCNKPKLPKLTLPRFRGDLTAWATFWDLYKSTVHDNNEILKVDKLSHC